MPNTTKLTANETAVLRAFPHFQFVSDHNLDELLAEEFGRSVWSQSFVEDAAAAAGITPKAARGVVTSLQKKGLITCQNGDAKDEDNIITITEAGLAQVVALQPDPEPTPDPEPEPEPTTGPEPTEPESGDGQDEVAVSGRFGVVWPQSVARLFWRALAKDGADILATAHGLSRESNQTKGELFIVGDHDAALRLALDLPELFHAANESLKQWRKTNDNYRRFLPLTKETAAPAFAAEQDYLRDFCRAVAGTFTHDMLAHDGIQAGLAYVNHDAEDAK